MKYWVVAWDAYYKGVPQTTVATVLEFPNNHTPTEEELNKGVDEIVDIELNELHYIRAVKAFDKLEDAEGAAQTITETGGLTEEDVS